MSKAKQSRAVTPSKTSQPNRSAEHLVSSPADLFPDVAQRHWLCAGGGLLLVAALLRFLQLHIAPMDRDEAANAVYLLPLFRENLYRFVPEGLQGPALYYFALAVTRLDGLLHGSGVTEAAVRCVPAIFGTATVGLLFTLRRYFGFWGALAAAALFAVSPASVYFSRSFIGEAGFVFFTLAMILAAIRYRDTASPAYLRVAAGAAAALLATKATAILPVLALTIAYLYANVYQGFLKRRTQPHTESQAAATETSLSRDESAFLDRAGGWRKLAVHIAIAAAVFACIYVSFYSSFGSNFRGVRESLRAYQFWAQYLTMDVGTGYLTYLRWLATQEPVLLIVGAAGFTFALYRGRNWFALFSGFWAVAVLVAYSLIPNKSPWLILNLVLPLAICGGYLVAEIAGALRGRKLWLQAAAGLVLAIPLLFSMGRAVRLSFVQYDDPSIAYSRSHTPRTFPAIVDKINEISARNGKGTASFITVTSPEYFPLHWYLRNYWNIRYWEYLALDRTDILIVTDRQDASVGAVTRGLFDRVGAYPERPGVSLVVYARRPGASLPTAENAAPVDKRRATGR